MRGRSARPPQVFGGRHLLLTVPTVAQVEFKRFSLVARQVLPEVPVHQCLCSLASHRLFTFRRTNARVAQNPLGKSKKLFGEYLNRVVPATLLRVKSHPAHALDQFCRACRRRCRGGLRQTLRGPSEFSKGGRFSQRRAGTDRRPRPHLDQCRLDGEESAEKGSENTASERLGHLKDDARYGRQVVSADLAALRSVQSQCQVAVCRIPSGSLMPAE